MARAGWNAASEIYRPEGSRLGFFQDTAADHRRWLRPLVEALPEGGRVLDLGCGCGVPDARRLSARFRVTGVDLSDTQIQRARRLVPSATFLRADMTRLRFPPRSFDGILCLYSLIHVPLTRQRAFLGRLASWLVPGGRAIIVTGHTAWTGTEEDWLGSGRPMYWSHGDVATYAQWFEEVGLATVSRRIVREPGASHMLFVLRRRDRPESSSSREASAGGGPRKGPESGRNLGTLRTRTSSRTVRRRPRSERGRGRAGGPRPDAAAAPRRSG